MILYTQHITARLTYIADFIGQLLLGKPFIITNHPDGFKAHQGPAINYSPTQIRADEFRISPTGLVFKTGTNAETIECFQLNGKPAFYKTEGDYPFDIFSASFYLLSRLEEYIPHEMDIYGRYAHENSLAFKEGFLNRPLVNLWVEDFKESLQSRFSLLDLAKPSFTFLPSYDIDEAWSFKHKSWWRNAGASVRELMHGRIENFRYRRSVLNGKEGDPFDSYEWMNELHRRYHLHPYYFFLVAEKNGRYDKNNLPKESAVKGLIKHIALTYRSGLHPSWQSGDELSLIKKEKELLEAIVSKPIHSSRQHFIRFTLPDTFRELIKAGIQEDFSMGYGSINGFRASVATPFYWYDLQKEEKTNLLLYPFCYMEANSFYEQKQTSAQALEEMRHYYREVKNVNGLLLMIWHNTFLGTDQRFKGWRDVYEQFIAEINA